MARRLKTNTLMARGAGGRFSGKTVRGAAILDKRLSKVLGRALVQNIKIQTQFESAEKNVLQNIEAAKRLTLNQTAFMVMRTAQEKIKTSPFPSKRGQPPRTRGRGRKSLRAAIKYFTDKKIPDAYIGPQRSDIGPTGRHHEFGLPRKKTEFDERPLMRPARDETLDRFVTSWRGVIRS